jgi:hypothetical protein
MQNVNARITFVLTDAENKVRHSSDVEYVGLDAAKVLLIEKHLIAALAGVNADAADQLNG